MASISVILLSCLTIVTFGKSINEKLNLEAADNGFNGIERDMVLPMKTIQNAINGNIGGNKGVEYSLLRSLQRRWSNGNGDSKYNFKKKDRGTINIKESTNKHGSTVHYEWNSSSKISISQRTPFLKNLCTPNSCKNNGTCVSKDNATQFSCQCGDWTMFTGDFCENDVRFMIEFPSQNLTNYINITKDTGDITEFSLCLIFVYATNQTSEYQTILNYRTPDSKNCSDLQIAVHGVSTKITLFGSEFVSRNVFMVKNFPVTLCVEWRSSDGLIKVFKRNNGVSKGIVGKGKVLKSPGNFIFGKRLQKVPSKSKITQCKTSENVLESYHGSMLHFYMFNKFLTDEYLLKYGLKEWRIDPSVVFPFSDIINKKESFYGDVFAKGTV